MPVAGGSTEMLDSPALGKGAAPVKDEKEEEKVEEEKKEQPSAGPGAFTSVKFSGQPPGGKSSITF